MDVVGFSLPDPEEFVGGRFNGGGAQGEGGKFCLEIIAIDNTKSFDGGGGGAIGPVGARGGVAGVGASF